MKEWRKKNPEKVKQANKKNYLKRSENPEIRLAATERTKQWRLQNLDRAKNSIRNATYKQKYGISLQEYASLLTKQKQVCKICERPDIKRLAVDHCHTTGKIRGLLCWRCNSTLGKVEDDINLLNKMINYLETSISESKGQEPTEDSGDCDSKYFPVVNEE